MKRLAGHQTPETSQIEKELGQAVQISIFKRDKWRYPAQAQAPNPATPELQQFTMKLTANGFELSSTIIYIFDSYTRDLLISMHRTWTAVVCNSLYSTVADKELLQLQHQLATVSYFSTGGGCQRRNKGPSHGHKCRLIRVGRTSPHFTWPSSAFLLAAPC